MNLENLTNKEIAALRRIGWAYGDFIQGIYYDDDSKKLHNDPDSIAHNAYFATLALCRECSKELERRGVEK